MRSSAMRGTVLTVCAASLLSGLALSCTKSEPTPGDGRRAPLPEASGPKKFAKALSKIDATVPKLKRSKWLIKKQDFRLDG